MINLKLKYNFVKSCYSIAANAMDKYLKRKLWQLLIYSIVICLCAVIFNKINQIFFDYVVQKDYKKLIISGGVWIFGLIIYQGFMSYVKLQESKISIYMREKLYNYFQSIQFDATKCLVPCQRMTDDLEKFTSQIINLFRLTIVSVVQLPLFCYIAFVNINFVAILVIFIYVALGSIVSKILSKSLINLEYEQENLEGILRKQLVIKIEERGKKFPNMTKVKQNYTAMKKKEVILGFFVSGYDQIGHLVPHIISVPLYIADKISFGQIIQFHHSFRTIFTSLSFFVNNRKAIADLTSVVVRLEELANK